MSRYAAGRRLEWKARKALEAQGYFVIRSAGSKGPVDLVAFHPDKPWPCFVQCKRSRFAPKERDALIELAISLQAVPVGADPTGIRDLATGTALLTWPRAGQGRAATPRSTAARNPTASRSRASAAARPPQSAG